MIDSIVQWLLQLISTIWYPWVWLAMFIESFFAPIPSELIMPFAGWLAADGKMNILLVIIVGSVGAYLGSLPFYLIGYWWNKDKIMVFVKHYGRYLFISSEEVEQWFDLFKKWGYGFVFFWRVIPLVRTFVSFPAGAVKMNFWIFSGLTLLWSFVWTTVLTYAGYVFGSQYEKVSIYMAQYEHIVLPIVVVIALWWIGKNIWTTFQKNKKSA